MDLPDLPDDPMDDGESTDEDEAAAERGEVASPDVTDPYEEALHRGADITGEGQISPD